MSSTSTRASFPASSPGNAPVSSKLLSFFDKVAARPDVSVEALFRGHEALLVGQRPARVSWDVLCDLYDRLDEIGCAGTSVESFGELVLTSNSLRGVNAALAAIASPHLMYRLANKWAGRFLLRHIEVGYEEVSKRRINIEYRIPESYRDCPNFFRVNHGTSVALPTLLGCPPATVRSTIEPRYHRMEIEVAPYSNLGS
ncbi:MAG: hypothetical protein V3V08_18705, partial [Nannocystaceae bacterium]